MSIVLIVRRTIRASASRVFEAWTQPEQLCAWWGPRPVSCASAQVDLRVGGRYRIVNLLPDLSLLAIEGVFQVVEVPRKLVYTWKMGDGAEESSLVTVRFEPEGDSTEVIIAHEQIPSAAVRDSHEHGWRGCLDGLERHFV
jgi:uncharacterized protein YndB with AHSA1/START domain